MTQQYYLRARFYNPVIARFTQEDTYRGDGLNLYAYCANNPVFYTDPTGLASACMKEAYKQELEQRTKAYVTEDMTAAEKDAALKRAKTDAYAAAKKVFETNHAANNPKPKLPEVTDHSMTREQWDAAYHDTRTADATVMSWNEFQNSKKGQYNKSQMSSAYANYVTSISGGTNQHYLHRPHIQQSTIDGVNAKTTFDAQGRPIVLNVKGDPYSCPNPDLGHVTGKEFWRMRNQAETKGLSQADFNVLMNDFNLYEWQDPSRNRKHMDEDTRP